MKSITLVLLASVAAAPLLAQENREMGAHVHGVSLLELAIEGNSVQMNLTSPGMDIVGFEYAPSTDADKDAVEAAIRTMLMPENIVTLPDAAECRLTEVLAHLHVGGDDHKDGEKHDHAKGEDHAHEDHAKDEDHAHEEGAAHSELHARYIFACEHPEKVTTVGFPFFERFQNAQEIEAQFVTDAGAGTAEISRDAATLTLN